MLSGCLCVLLCEQVGTWYDTFEKEYTKATGQAYEKGSASYIYPNTQRPSTAWYHDHALGLTRLNVYGEQCSTMCGTMQCNAGFLHIGFATHKGFHTASVMTAVLRALFCSVLYSNVLYSRCHSHDCTYCRVAPNVLNEAYRTRIVPRTNVPPLRPIRCKGPIRTVLNRGSRVALLESS